jgi:hypothetical protein
MAQAIEGSGRLSIVSIDFALPAIASLSGIRAAFLARAGAAAQPAGLARERPTRVRRDPGSIWAGSAGPCASRSLLSFIFSFAFFFYLFSSLSRWTIKLVH